MQNSIFCVCVCINQNCPIMCLTFFNGLLLHQIKARHKILQIAELVVFLILLTLIWQVLFVDD
uniref:Uncharacterized protein n=1 Tax=Rhizophora mucronata TaxID=61149 RepID=A0A2P2MRF6_RHIMU